VIPTIITQALTGDEIRLGNLRPARDFTFFGDTVDGFLRIAAADEAVGKEINLGTGVMITIGDLVQRISNLVGKDLKIIEDADRRRPDKSEVMRLRASAKRAVDLLGWQPRVSLEEGLKITIEWIADHIEQYKPGQYLV
jgi:nucleoside-diphosphate-sugar epimerase